MKGYSPYTKGSPEPLDQQAVIERQRGALKRIREIMTDMNGCLDFLDVLGKIDEAVSSGLGEKKR